MNIHEYQAKEILKFHGVPVPGGIVAASVDEAIEAAKQVQQATGTRLWVIKAQIHAGGRGKGGGVKIAKDLSEVAQITSSMIGMQLITPQTGVEGKTVHRVLVAPDVFYPGESEVKEFYISVLLNRATGRNMVVYSPQGGVDIEFVAENTPYLIFREEIVPGMGLQDFQARNIAFGLGLTGKAFSEMIIFAKALVHAYERSDAALIEINPLVKTSDNRMLAVDAKMTLDDNALFRHPEYALLRDLSEENPSEVEATRHHLNFVKLNGNVGCMVNGAGLAMATMDIIKLSGGEPANFLDVGGGANATSVEAGLKIILADSRVKVVLINVFGGIVRCDRVASGVVEAYHKIGHINVPIIVRLQGTNALEGKTIIDQSGLKVYSAVTLHETAQLVNQLVQ